MLGRGSVVVFPKHLHEAVVLVGPPAVVHLAVAIVLKVGFVDPRRVSLQV